MPFILTMTPCHKVLASFAWGAVACCSVTSAMAQQGDAPTVLELMQLPPRCQVQMVRDYQLKVPPVTAPPGQGWEAIGDRCGTHMNHFCPGLWLLNRAAKLDSPKANRKYAAQHARVELDYTKRYMPPTCPIKAEVEAADVLLRMHETLLK